MPFKKLEDSYIGYLNGKISNNEITLTKFLKEFEKLNTTTESIFDLDDFEVLIILNDGRNLTSWDDVENKGDIIYVSEDLSECHDLSYKYSGLVSLKAIVVTEFPAYNFNAEAMFYGCESLVDISCLKNWDVTGIKDMRAMFHDCKSLKDISALKDWNVSKVRNMQSMFNSCWAIEDLNALRNWNVSCVSSMNHMFFGCRSLASLRGLDRWNVSNVENMAWMFSSCCRLVNLEGLNNWNVSSSLKMDYMFMGCESLSDVSSIDDWNVGFSIRRYVFSYCKSLKRIPDWFVAY